MVTDSPSKKLHRQGLARLPELGVPLVLGRRPVYEDGRSVNQGFLWSEDGGLVPLHTKQFFPDEPGYYQARWLEPGKNGKKEVGCTSRRPSGHPAGPMEDRRIGRCCGVRLLRGELEPGGQWPAQPAVRRAGSDRRPVGNVSRGDLRAVSGGGGYYRSRTGLLGEAGLSRLRRGAALQGSSFQSRLSCR